ncbi:MAG: myo-inosose-2 dehydratase [Pseudomonadota bacterium]
MSVRIGINPITWTNDDVPELGGDTPLETCLSEMAEAGYVGTELGGKYPRDAAVLSETLDRYGLSLVSGWYDGRLAESDVAGEFDRIEDHLTLLRACGATCVVYADTSLGRTDGIWQAISRRPTLSAEDWPGYCGQLTELALRMADFGVRMAFHHHMGTIVETDAEVARLMEGTGPEVGLLFDSGHSAFAGGDPVRLCQAHAARIVHVHCKDVRPEILADARARDIGFMDAVLAGIFTVPGDGALDFAAMLRTLKDADYAGWLVVEAEQDPAKAHPLTYAKMGHDTLLRLAEATGFTVIPREEERT